MFCLPLCGGIGLTSILILPLRNTGQGLVCTNILVYICFFIFGNSNKLLEKTPDKSMQLQSFPSVWTVVCFLYLWSRHCSQLPVRVLSLRSLQGPRALAQPALAGEGLEHQGRMPW